MKAAVMRGVGRLAIEDLGTPAELRPDEVRVATRAVGVCHSDLHVLDGHLERPLPMVLGHEASGVVTEVGDAVTGVGVGDRVAVCLVVHCGRCRWCRRGRYSLCGNKAATNRPPDVTPRLLDADGAPVTPFSNIGALADEMVLHHSAVTPMPDGIPFDAAALLGCAVGTGVGTVENVARVGVHDSVVVIGCGGVGLNICAAARVAGADVVIAVDLDAARRARALDRFGATHAVDGGDPVAVAEVVASLTGGGADHVFDAVGLAAVSEHGLSLVAPGGALYTVGIFPDGSALHVPTTHLHSCRSVIGVRMGDIDPARDLPALAQRYLDGTLPLDDLITAHVDLDDVGEAFDALRSVDGARTIVRFREAALPGRS